MPLTSVKVTELKKKRDKLEAKQKQAKEDRETAKIAMVNKHTTKDGEMTRVVVAALDKKSSKAGVELSAMFKPMLDLVSIAQEQERGPSKAEKKAAAKAMTAAMASLGAGSTPAPMERICSVVQRGSKRSLEVGSSVGAKGRAEDEKQEDRGCKSDLSQAHTPQEDRTTPLSAESVE